MKKIEIQKSFLVTYEVNNELLKVKVEGIGEKSSQLGGLSEEALAKQLATEIIDEFIEKNRKN